MHQTQSVKYCLIVDSVYRQADGDVSGKRRGRRDVIGYGARNHGVTCRHGCRHRRRVDRSECRIPRSSDIIKCDAGISGLNLHICSRLCIPGTWRMHRKDSARVQAGLIRVLGCAVDRTVGVAIEPAPRSESL